MVHRNTFETVDKSLGDIMKQIGNHLGQGISDEAKLGGPEHIMHRAILTSKNSDVYDINNAVMELFPGEVSMV